MTLKGLTTLAVTNTKIGESQDVEFFVVKKSFTCLMGSTTVQEMGLLTVHGDKFVAEVKQSQVNKSTARKTMIRDRKKTTLNAVDGKGKCPHTKVGVEVALNYQTACKCEVGDLGRLGMATVKTGPIVLPKVLPSRRLPIALRKPAKPELDTLLKRGVLIPVQESTP